MRCLEYLREGDTLIVIKLDRLAQTMAVWSAPNSGAITPGFSEVRDRAASFAKENANAAFKLAKDVTQANDLQELLNLQTRYVQSQMKWYADQTQEFGQLMAKAFINQRTHQTDTKPSASDQKTPSKKP
jgi:hypothetical protein